MERPNRNDDYVNKAAARRLAPELEQWSNLPSSHNFFQDALEVIESCGHKNAYELARQLESEGYEPDLMLVELLDNAAHYRSQAHTQAVKEWVKGWNITTPFNVGDKVWSSKHNAEGEITEVYADVARVLVCLESMGHVREGLGTKGFILDCEALETVNVPANT